MNLRNTYALINLKNLKHNIKEIKNYYNDYKYYIGVVKANAYGHGDIIAKTLEEAGLNYLAVSSLEEGISVRKYTKLPILCFGYIDTKDIDLAIKNNITLSIISYEYYQELLKLNKNIKVHLKINSGMNRFGINDKNQVKEIVDNLKKSKIELEGIYTHLATSGVNDPYYDYQIKKFQELTQLIDLKEIPIVHIFNSLGLARHKKLPYANGIRVGLMMYGFTYNLGKMSIKNRVKRRLKLHFLKVSKTILTNNLKLKKVLSLHSEVISINKVKEGEFVGYNASYIAPYDTPIAVIPIGHADGINNNYKKVMINQKLYDIVGICMDYIMVKVDEQVKLHDVVDIINEKITIGSIAGKDSPHHILVSISNRVDRKYEE